MATETKQSAELLKQLLLLQQQLLMAAKQQQWPQLRQLDKQISVLLSNIKLAGLEQHFATQTELLHKTYRHVLTQLRAEQNRTQQLINTLITDKEGIVAYQQTVDGVS